MDIFQDLFIFEMANNHQGSVDHGLTIIDAMGQLAKQFGIRAAVKFQYRQLDTFIHPDFVDRQDVKHIPRFMSTRLAPEQFLTMVDAVRTAGMITMVTPFDEPSVDTCLEHGIDILKIASCSALDWPLLERAASAEKPVIVSTGGACLADIDRTESFLRHKKAVYALMHCVGRYPVPDEAVAMGMVSRMCRRYPGVTVGYSGHEAPDSLTPVQVAVACGASILERHVGVPTDAITLNAYSMNPEQTAEWIEAALSAKRVVGRYGEKEVCEQEISSLRSLKRGVFAKNAISTGQSIRREDVFFAMPIVSDEQLDSGLFGTYRSRYVASKNYAPGGAICEEPWVDPVSNIRGVIHGTRGMLNEAGISVGDEVQFEISHHFGMEKFAETGCVLINVVNRRYCKKLIVVMAGQENPTHMHKVKEETFQVLWGDLTVKTPDTDYRLRAGDVLLMEPGVYHSFNSEDGCVFEEVSTQHVHGDSYYANEEINKMDILQRKTVVEGW